MSILKTKESLQRMFEERKRQQEKKQNRQEHKQQTKQILQAIYRHQDILLKKSLQELRKTTMDNLSTLIKQTPQKEKEPQIQLSYHFYQDTWQLKEPNDIDLYHSIEELKEAEERLEGKINWENWNNIVQLTKEQINQYERNKT